RNPGLRVHRDHRRRRLHHALVTATGNEHLRQRRLALSAPRPGARLHVLSNPADGARVLASTRWDSAQWREATESLGGGTWHYWRYIAGPLLAPAFLGATLLLFANAFSAYATAAAL